jgi:hypothetical protein
MVPIAYYTEGFQTGQGPNVNRGNCPGKAYLAEGMVDNELFQIPHLGYERVDRVIVLVPGKRYFEMCNTCMYQRDTSTDIIPTMPCQLSEAWENSATTEDNRQIEWRGVYGSGKPAPGQRGIRTVNAAISGGDRYFEYERRVVYKTDALTGRLHIDG